MKKFFQLVSFAVLLAIPYLGWGQVGTIRLAPVVPPTVGTIGTNMLNQVLAIAAPQFGFVPSEFIRMYADCACIVVTEIGPQTYLVVYGGVGIQIVIDGCRLHGGGGKSYGVVKNHTSNHL